MNKFLWIWMTAVLSLFAFVSLTAAQDKEALHLVQMIPLPNVKGRIDHMDVDVDGKRLFVAGLENGSVEVVDLQAGKWLKSIPDSADTKRKRVFVSALGNNSLEVIDTFAGRVIHSIKGLSQPQGPLYVAEFDKLYVANAGDGKVHVFDGATYTQRKKQAR